MPAKYGEPSKKKKKMTHPKKIWLQVLNRPDGLACQIWWA